MEKYLFFIIADMDFLIRRLISFLIKRKMKGKSLEGYLKGKADIFDEKFTKYLKSLNSLPYQTLINMIEDDIYLAQLIERYTDLRLDEGYDVKSKVAIFNKLDEVQKCVFLIEGFQRELNNGGIDQYFVNSPGIWIEDLVPALEKIGAKISFKVMNNVFQDIVSKIGKKGKELKQLLWNDEVLEENISESWLKMENEIFQNYDIKPDYVRKLINELKQES